MSLSLPVSPLVPSADRLPRLLSPAGEAENLSTHLSRLGAAPRLPSGELTRLLESAGLTGRGGAAFPTFRKLRAVTSGGGRAVVIGNGAEGEPASGKDRLLLLLAPHLVLDGLQLAAAEVDARQVVLYLPPDDEIAGTIERAIAERTRSGSDRYAVATLTAPDRFIAGEESAVVNRVSGGYAIPRSKPPAVYERGVRGRPTLVDNVETLAHIALIARYGAKWFRGLGTPDEPGSLLLTVSGAVDRHCVTEAALGSTLADVVAAAGGTIGPVGAVLVGGYHGAWLPPAPNGRLPELRLLNFALRPAGAALGAGVVVVLPAARCGLIETARVAYYLAGESARQCGPCLNGLPELAGLFGDLAVPGGSARAAAEIRRVSGLLARRGACHHPDGSIRFLRSALKTFAGEIDLHVRGRCTGTDSRPVLPIPLAPTDSSDWR